MKSKHRLALHRRYVMRQGNKKNPKTKFNIIVVGAGGTGGNLLKELGRFLKFYKKLDWHLTIIDGDRVEEKNTERQPFGSMDTMQNKAAVMREGLIECFNLSESKITAIADYIDGVRDLHGAATYCNDDQQKPEQVILVGCVDNHRARQVMHQFFYETDSIIYIDCANEFSNGEVAVGVRFSDVDIAPPRGYYYPDVLTDRSPSAKELSCGVVNVSAPQHMVTNLMCANHALSFIADLMQNGKCDGGILRFDAFKHYSRFEPWLNEEGVPGREEVMP